MRRFDGARKQAAFTLLEVMVALAVAAIGLAAVSRSMSGNVEVANRVKDRTLATWVAANRMAELRMYRQFSTAGAQSGRAEMGGRAWRIEERFDTTPDPNIARVDIEVFPVDGDFSSATLTGYLARYRQPEGQ